MSARDVIARGCTIVGCQNKHRSKGFCEGHYERWRKFGDNMDRGPVPVSPRRQAHKAPKRPTMKIDISIADMAAWLDYDSDTGEFRWRIKRGPINTGDRASHKTRKGYLTLYLGGRQYFAHRVAWAIVHGEWPPHQIDHINGDKSDNRLVNLRLATQTQNQGNRKSLRTNTTGYKGVTYSRSNAKFRAQITENGKRRAIGHFATAEEAAKAYDAAAIEHFGEFALLNFPAALHSLGDGK